MRTYTFKLRALLAVLAMLILSFIGINTASADNHIDTEGDAHYGATLLGGNEVPPVSTTTESGATTTGEITTEVNSEQTELSYNLDVFDGEDITVAHLHCAAAGEEGPPVVMLFGPMATGTDIDGNLASGTVSAGDVLPAGEDCETAITDIASLETAILDGIIYANVHSELHPDGVIRGQLEEVAQDDGDSGIEFEVAIDVENGTTTANFTYDGTDYEVEVNGTSTSTVLDAIAAEIGTTTDALDDDFVEEVTNSLAEAIDDESNETFDVNVTISEGTTTVAFTYGGTEYEVEANATSTDEVLQAIADELGTTTDALDDDFVEEVTEKLAAALEDDGSGEFSNVEVEVENGTTTVSFTRNDTYHEVEVNSSDIGDVLEAIATELGMEVDELDDDFVEEVTEKLEEELDDEEDFDVEVEVEDGSTTVSFTYDGTDYEVEVDSTDTDEVLEAIATELGMEVDELDDDFVEEVTEKLEEELDDEDNGGIPDDDFFQERREQLQERIDEIRERIQNRFDTLEERFDNIFGSL